MSAEKGCCTVVMRTYLCYIDVNECATGMDECQQVCEDTVGSFRCLCFSGYDLNADFTSCSGQSIQLLFI